MFFRLFLLFTLVPLVELYALIRLGGLIGAGPTILLVLATGAAGAWLARQEGFRSWRAVQAELAAGRLPTEELLHTLLVVIAGVLLVTPGIFTDALGLLMLIRPVRAAMIRAARSKLARSLEAGEMRVWVHPNLEAGRWGPVSPGSGPPTPPDLAEPSRSGGEGEPRRGRVIDL